MARAARRRTAGPDVLHGRAKHGLSRRRAGPERRRARPDRWPIDTSCAHYADRQGLASLAELVVAATTEFENVPADQSRIPRANAPASRRRPKAWPSRRTVSAKSSSSRRNGFAVAPFAVLATEADARAIDPALAAGHRQERALRLRRQRSDSRRCRGGRPRGVAAMGAAPCVLERHGLVDAASCR